MHLILKDFDADGTGKRPDGHAGLNATGAQGVSRNCRGTKKSGLTVVTLISTPNPVSQVLW